MKRSRPLTITLIGDIYFLSALISVVSVIFPNILSRVGLYNIHFHIFLYNLIEIISTIILVAIFYGFMKLKIWGYWLSIIYNIIFLAINIMWSIQISHLLITQNAIWAFIALIIIIPTKKHFN